MQISKTLTEWCNERISIYFYLFLSISFFSSFSKSQYPGDFLPGEKKVENKGVEPLTSWMQIKRSSQLS